jgi:recombination associated protein RdgC
VFKNVWVHRVASGWPASFDVLEAALQHMPFVPCGASQDKSVGWVSPRHGAAGGEGAPLVESVNGHWMLRFMAEVRQVPSSVVARRVADMAAQIEATTGRKPGKKEKRDLKEDAMAALLPQAFPREQSTWVWLDTEHHRLVLDTTSSGRADDIITALVKLLDGFAVEPLNTATSPAVAMAAWLTEQAAPAGFDIGKECELKSSDETQAVVRYARHPLLTDEVRDHIAAGKQPTRLSLDWDGRVNFVLTDTLQLKKVSFADDVLEQAKAQGQRADDFDGSVLMLTAEIGPLIGDLIDALDGLAEIGPSGTPSAGAQVQATASTPAPTAARSPASATTPASAFATTLKPGVTFSDDDPPF